jgi:rhodanese-related sulfurtransferase
MKNKFYYLFSGLIVLSMLLGACASATPATQEPAVAETEEAVVEPTTPPEPTPEPTEPPPPPEATEEELDAAYTTMLETMVKYNTTSADALLEAMATDQPPFLLDVRTAEEVEENGHIEGAVNIPLDQLAQNLELLPAFDTEIVTYCAGGWRATIAMTALNALGWNNVKALKVAFADWVDAENPVVEGPAAEAEVLDAAQPDEGMVTTIDKMLTSMPKGYGGVTAEDLNLALAENPDMGLMDVRTSGEVEQKGYISVGEEDPIFVPLEEFIANKDLWPADKDAALNIYCGSGHRSTMAMAMLWSYGYSDVTSLKGGFGGWAGEGYPVTGGIAKVDTAFQFLLDNMEKYNTITMEPLNEALASDTPPFLLDVRTAPELEERGHITGAVHIPLQELTQHIDLLPDFDTPIVVYCGSGWRATIAMTALGAMGWTDVKALKNTFQEWVDAGNAVEEGPAAEDMVLDVADPDPDVLAALDGMISNIPEGYGVTTDEALNETLVDNPEMKLIDVRRVEELEENGVIDSGGAEQTHIPLESFIEMKDQWPADAAADITVYCGSGHRSTMAMTMLWTYDYLKALSLKGGFGNWLREGYPVLEYVAP